MHFMAWNACELVFDAVKMHWINAKKHVTSKQDTINVPYIDHGLYKSCLYEVFSHIALCSD